MLLAFHTNGKIEMTRLKVLSAALIAAAMLATPAMARESRLTSRHLAEDANASATPGARYIGEGDVFRGNHFGDASGLNGGSRGYGGRDVWGHRGAYYGPMIPNTF